VLAAAVHILTILSVWCTCRGLDLSFSLVDSAVRFILMVGVALLPFSFGGWGVREGAVVALLTSQGFPAEQALFFSVCFGVILVLGCMPGALVWAIYSPVRAAA
jgi:glycosyltransferase 2 family protein